MKRLTEKQRETLERIEAVRNVQVRQLQQVIAEHAGDDFFKDAKPSEWVSWVTLVATHSLNKRVIAALVKKGYLERRDTDGWGPEVRVNRSLCVADTTSGGTGSDRHHG